MFGIVSALGFSEILDNIKAASVRLVFSILVFSIVVFNCTLTTHPRLWPNYERAMINMTKVIKAEYPDVTLLSNNAVVAYILDVAPTGGLHFAQLNTKMFKKYSDCLILWDPFSSNSIFFQTELTKENVLNDSKVTVLESYRYWSAEYLLLRKQ
jgi:hypothetical protein